MKRLISGLPLFLTATALLAQDDATASATPTQLTEAQAAGAIAACGILGLIPIVISLGIWLWIAIWIMKDSARRQSPNRTLVVVLGWLVPIVGLIVHLATRPKTIPGANP
jgi:heme/copper-type cytochrome/quinol oxidase subunit 2